MTDIALQRVLHVSPERPFDESRQQTIDDGPGRVGEPLVQGVPETVHPDEGLDSATPPAVARLEHDHVGSNAVRAQLQRPGPRALRRVERDGQVTGPPQLLETDVEAHLIRVVGLARVRHGLRRPAAHWRPGTVVDGHLDVNVVLGAVHGETERSSGRVQRRLHLGLEPGHQARVRGGVHSGGDGSLQHVAVLLAHRVVDRVHVPTVFRPHADRGRPRRRGLDHAPAPVETRRNIAANARHVHDEPANFGVGQIRLECPVGAELIERALHVHLAARRVDRQILQTSAFQVLQLGVSETDEILLGHLDDGLLDGQWVFDVQQVFVALVLLDDDFI